MRWSQTFIPTLREKPAEAEVKSHELLLRAGYIRKLLAGAYTYLPLGYRTLHKIINIVRKHMDNAGALEVLMPAMQPPELWEESGRLDALGEDMVKFIDRHKRTVIMGPTHEEVITDLVRREISSYKELPIILYQIQTKFRDEARPRFGILRSREFIMKDAYSFDKDVEGLEKSYKKMYEAYCKIFQECGLDYTVVEADTGVMGGDVSHEFMVVANTGEDKMAICTRCNYRANIETVKCLAPKNTFFEKQPSMEEVYTPEKRKIQEVAEYLGISADELLKSVMYKVDNEFLMVVIRGDFEVNEAKLQKVLKTSSLVPADEEMIKNITGSSAGFCGPVGLDNVKIIADHSVLTKSSFVCGANKENYHLKNVVVGRDFKIEKTYDIREVVSGDVCPICQEGRLVIKNAIELGHIFKLGTKYSAPMKLYYLDEDGKRKPVIMGCYGIGINRIMATLVEVLSDEDGICWPISVSPYHLLITLIDTNEKEIFDYTYNLYKSLSSHGIEVLFDDRPIRGGVKFKDADLIGIPYRITIGKRSYSKGKIELKVRKTKEVIEIEKEKAEEFLVEYLKEKIDGVSCR